MVLEKAQSPLDGSKVGSNGILGNNLDLKIAQKEHDPLEGSAVGSNGITSNDLDKAIEAVKEK